VAASGLARELVFGGGAAPAALHLHHRTSLNVDFFATRQVGLDELTPLTRTLVTRSTAVHVEVAGLRTSLVLRRRSAELGRIDFAYHRSIPSAGARPGAVSSSLDGPNHAGKIADLRSARAAPCVGRGGVLPLRDIALMGAAIHTSSMQKTTLVIDQVKLRRVRKVLGTKGIRDTVDRALDEVLALDARRRLVEKLRTMNGLDLDDPDVMAGAWR
jgi:hypothetical protein